MREEDNAQLEKNKKEAQKNPLVQMLRTEKYSASGKGDERSCLQGRESESRISRCVYG